MIINGKYVDYTLASLLKEKGFDEKIETLITPENKVYFLDENSVTNLKHIKISNSNTNPYSDDVSCPDLWDVMKWLREEHHYYIQVMVDSWACGGYMGYFVVIRKTDSDFKLMLQDVREQVFYDTPEEAYEDAIKYCLENLI